MTTHLTSPEARRGLRHVDTVTLLTVFIVLLVAIPSKLVVGPIGAAGTPANLFAILLLSMWGGARIGGSQGIASGSQPVRVAMWLFGAGVLAGYATGMLRPGIAGLEVSAADRAMLAVFAWFGIALATADGVMSRERLDVMLRRLVNAGACLAVLGIVQFTTGLNPVGQLHIPGLRANAAFGELAQRSIFRRVEGTAIHPIEFGVVLGLILPLALHYAWFARPEEKFRRWAAVALIAAALPMTVARSAVLTAFVVLLVLFPTWDRRRKVRALVVMPIFAVVMRLLVPGLLGTVKSLFLNAGSDPSVKGRQEDYHIVAHYIGQHPWFGRGFGTFIPELYRVSTSRAGLDNQYLGTLVEVGLVGLLLLLLLFGIGVATARGARLRSVDARSRDLAQSLAAAICAAAVAFFTFDAYAFPMIMGLLFLLVGSAGALWRLQGGFATAPQPSRPRTSVLTRIQGRNQAVLLAE